MPLPSRWKRNIRNLAKTSLIAGIALAICASAHAARFEAGRGIANDRATGAGPNDVTFVTRGNGNAYGWRGWDMAIGGTILPWSIPNEESNVYGLRINLGWGSYASTYGIDAGAFSSSTQDFGGIGNYVTRTVQATF